MRLNDREWKSFSVPSVFPAIQRGKRLKNADHIPGSTPYVSSTASNNGVDDFIEVTKGTRVFSDCISIANSGSVGTAFYEPFPFVASDHVTSLKRKGANKYIYLFLATVLEQQRSNFNFNREINDQRINQMHIMLPVNESGEPDYQFMEDYIRELMGRKYKQYRDYANKTLSSITDNDYVNQGGWNDHLTKKNWTAFVISEVFDILPGKRLVAADATEGQRPFIGALDNNNGVARFVNDRNSSIDKNVLGVNYNGNGMVIGFYHPYECIFSDDVKRFHLKHYEDNQFVLLFMKVCILMQKKKFGYLYKFNAERMAHTSIMLPVTESGDPDYPFMELYGKLLCARKYEQYLSVISMRVE